MPQGKKYNRLFKSISVALAIGMLFSCTNDMEQVKAMTEEMTLPVQTIYNAEFNYTELGKLKNKLLSPRLDRYVGEENLLVADEGFQLVIFDSLGVRESILEANWGTFDETERTVLARDDVRLTNVSGEKLATEELHWAQDSGLVWTDMLVTISTANGDTIYGKDGMVSNETFSEYKLKGVTAELNVDDSTIGQDPAD